MNQDKQKYFQQHKHSRLRQKFDLIKTHRFEKESIFEKEEEKMLKPKSNTFRIRSAINPIKQLHPFHQNECTLLYPLPQRRNSIYSNRCINALMTHQTMVSTRSSNRSDFISLKEYKENQLQINVKYTNKHQSSMQAFLLQQFVFVSLICSNKISPVTHPSILPVYGKILLNSISYFVVKYFEDETLQQFVENYFPLPHHIAVAVLHQITQCLNIMHKKHSIHGSLTCKSVVIQNNGKVLLSPIRMEAIKYHYIAPQTLRGKILTQKQDVWGLGSIALKLFSHKNLHSLSLHPYNQTYLQPDKHSIKDILKPYPQKNYKIQVIQIQKKVQQFIQLCLKIDFDQRPKIQQLLSHRIFQ